MRNTTLRRPLIVALAAILALTSCSPRPEGEVDGVASRLSQPSRSALGRFLAARLAQAQGDSKAAADYYLQALEKDQDNIDLMQRAFTTMVAEGRIETALPIAERLVELDADSPLPLLVLGAQAARNQDFAAAEARFQAIPRRGMNTFLAPLLTAWARAGQGHTDSALDALGVLAQNNGLKPLHAFHAGLINDLANRSQAADEHYQVALAGQLNIRSVEAAGSLYQRTGHSERAKQLYDQYSSEHPETLLFDGTALLNAGTQVLRPVNSAAGGLAEAAFDVATLMRQGNATDASMIFARLALALQPDFPLAQMTVADILSAQGRTSEANDIYRSINPASPVQTFGRIKVAMNMDDAGQTEAALADLAKLSDERPSSIDALVTMGDIYRRHKDYPAAAKAYSGAIARITRDQSEHWALYYSRGISFERSKEWPKAEADFMKALELKPEQPDVLNYLGYSWIDMGLKLDEGRQMIEKAVQIRPSDGAIVDSLGWALYRLGDFQNAVKTLERAIQLKPEDPTINDHLGDAYWQVGRVDEAREQWRRATTFDPEPDQAKVILDKIKSGELPAKPLAR